jgi:hypothetical protein
MIGEQTFEGHRENLSQAGKLSRTFAVLLDALNRHRGKGQQKVTVEHVHVHSGGQAVVGVVEPPGVVIAGNQRTNPCKANLPMHLSNRCGRGQGAGSCAKHRQCRTAGGECTTAGLKSTPAST